MFAGKTTWVGAFESRERINLAYGGPREPADPVIVERTPSAVFAHRPTPLAAWYGDEPLAGRGLWRERHYVGVADARLDNRDELADALGLPRAELARTSDAALLCRAVTRWGDAGLGKVLGAFAFAIWDGKERRLTLGRDCFGHRTLFYHVGDGWAAFATSLNNLFAMPGVPRAIDDVAVANFTVFSLLTAPEQTLYRGIARVPSRTVAAVDANGTRQWHYWRPDPRAAADCKSENDFVARGRELFDAAVRRATAGRRKIAIAASGGLDSAALVATVARMRGPEAITCYTQVAPENFDLPLGPNLYLDETAKIAALARMYPGLQTRSVRTDAIHPTDRDWSLYFARTGLPAFGPVRFSTSGPLLDAVAADGHETLFFGGFGNHGMSWGGPYVLLELLRSGQIVRFMRELAAQKRARPVSLPAILRNMVAVRAVPPRVRHAVARMRGRDPFDTTRRGALNPQFIADAGLRAAWQAQGFAPLGHLERGGREHRERWNFDFNQFGRDGRALLPEWAGLELRDPYADRELAEFLVAVPEPLFNRGGVHRAFARRVFADRLPAEIAGELRYGAQNVGWYRHLAARRDDMAADLEDIARSPRVRRILDLPRLKAIFAAWPADEAAAQGQERDYVSVLSRAIYIGRFIRWAEGANR
ncbi:MAG TPA: asparagine synthase-related protein [Pseudolabrys sp.]|nr:asparagine synthase-related protein [Pseudolabrys sp.]